MRSQTQSSQRDKLGSHLCFEIWNFGVLCQTVQFTSAVTEKVGEVFRMYTSLGKMGDNANPEGYKIKDKFSKHSMCSLNSNLL